MALWTGTATFRDGSGQAGQSEWVVEAFEETLAREMVSRALARDGLVLRDLPLRPVDPAVPLTGPFADVGAATALREGPRTGGLAAQGTGSHVTPRAPQRDAGSADAPDWIAPALWDALFLPRDAARVYAVVDGGVWEAGTGTSIEETIEAEGLTGASLYGAATEQDLRRAGPWLIDVSLEGQATVEPGTLRKVLFREVLPLHTGLYLRDPADFAQMRARLRKLTKVRDVDDSWYFNRFWEPEFFLYFTLFLQGRSMLAPLAGITSYALTIEGGIVVANTDFSGSVGAPRDREEELNRLFAAGAVMVCLRRARTLEAEHGHGVDPDDVYGLVQAVFGLEGIDYRFVERLTDIAYVLRKFYAEEAVRALPAPLIDGCFDEEGQITQQVDFLHGLCMFGLGQNVEPAALPLVGEY